MSDLPSHVELLVLGSGSAASKVAEKAAKSGVTVALVENRDLGGTCALRGCNPKKVMTRAAGLIDYANAMSGKYTSEETSLSLDWDAMRTFQRTFTEKVSPSTKESLDEAGVHVAIGQPTLTDPTTCRVEGATVSFDRLVIGTGAGPADAPFDGGQHTITSDEFLELDACPESIVFIGGGYISSEFAHVAAIAGAKVTIIERSERLLEAFDPDLVRMLQDRMRKRGIALHFDSEVHRITKDGDRCTVHFGDESHPQSVEAACVVRAIGRVPSIDTLDLDAAGIAYGKKGIAVDRSCRSTSQPHVWAVGDCADHGEPMLTPTANESARAVSRQFAGEEDAVPDFGPVPQAAFTLPPMASVGLSEDAARSRHGDDLTIKHESMDSWTTFRKVGADTAAYKTIIEKSTGRLVGAHLIGPEAPELINLFAMALRFEMTRYDVKSVLFAYPTLGSELRAMV